MASPEIEREITQHLGTCKYPQKAYQIICYGPPSIAAAGIGIDEGESIFPILRSLRDRGLVKEVWPTGNFTLQGAESEWTDPRRELPSSLWREG